MNNQKRTTGDLLATASSILSGILFIHFMSSDRVIAGFFVAISGVAALPSLRGVFLRYGADKTRRRNIALGSFALAFISIVALPSPNHPELPVAVV